MQEHIILPSKRRVDIHRIEAPFDQFLLPEEVIVEGSCQVVVFSGEDPDPSHMLEGDVQIVGSIVRQRIKLGLPGVIYLLIFEAETNQGNIYRVEAKQAVLEDQIPAGPIYQTYYFTSPPYPVELIDPVESSFDILSALYRQIPIDSIDSTFGIVSGALRDIVRSYQGLPEGIESLDFDIVSGILKQIVISYEGPPEGINSTGFDIVSGDLYGTLIVYTNWPGEGITSSFDIVSGTLT